MGLSSVGRFFAGLDRSFLFFVAVDFSTREPLGPRVFDVVPLCAALLLRTLTMSEPRDGVGGDVAGVLYD